MTTEQHLTAKELTRRALDHLPDDADVGEVIERILFLHVLQKRLARADSEPVYTQEEIEREIAEWHE
jgi:hypothetical protein